MKFSIAMATYNGEKYIEEQLRSICLQTIKPDEIVVSDDGSKDNTLNIVEKIASSEIAKGIDFKILKDNPRHGYCGNFEWALKHTTGDYIFLSDQDDVWYLDKIEKTVNCLKMYSDAMLIFTDGDLIDKDGKPIKKGEFWIYRPTNIDFNSDKIVRIRRENCLDQVASRTLCNGMVMCISRKLFEVSRPFPMIRGFHDQWLAFCALVQDSCYYIDEKLVHYRLHGQNTAGNPAFRGNVIDRMRKVSNRVRSSNLKDIDLYYLGERMKRKLEEADLMMTEAYKTACRLVEIGEKQKDAFTSRRLVGSFKLCKLFVTDIRYRRSGTKAFLCQLLGVLIK